MGAGGVKNFSVGICDGAPSTARSSCFCSFESRKKTCHKVSVIHVTQPKLCLIQIVVPDIVDQAVTNVQLNMSFV